MPRGLAGRETLGPNLMVIGPSSVRCRPPRVPGARKTAPIDPARTKAAR
jgi:hypothetical protein